MRRAALIAPVLIAALAAALLWHPWRGGAGRALQVPVPGGDGGGLPLSGADQEHLDAAALERIPQDAAAGGLQALLVMRHGHLVYSRYGKGTDANTVIDSGGFADALIALATGIAVDERLIGPAPLLFQPAQLRALIETASHQSYAAFLGSRLWARLNAAPAWIGLPAAAAPLPADCCFHARVADWLRVGALLANEGDFEDTAIVSRRWIERMRQPQPNGAGYGVALPSRRPGAASYAAADLFLLRGPGHWRLWMVPSLRLVVLFGAAGRGGDGAAADDWDETRVPNLVIEAVTDRPAVPPGTSLLQQLVPGH